MYDLSNDTLLIQIGQLVTEIHARGQFLVQELSPLTYGTHTPGNLRVLNSDSLLTNGTTFHFAQHVVKALGLPQNRRKNNKNNNNNNKNNQNKNNRVSS